MAEFYQIIATLLLCLSLLKNPAAGSEPKTQTESSKEELVQSESKDGNLEIIKQIKKVNGDGSYTVGYEADDGSFKIESRDVLGNIKGTYGYVDDDGEIKRVSYSTSNSSEVLTKHSEQPSVVQRIPKSNRTSTKEPSYYSTTTQPSNLAQRLNKFRPSSSTTAKPNYSTITSVDNELSTKSPLYASSTPRILLSRPVLRSTSPPLNQKSEGQIIRPEVVITPRPTTELPLFRRLALKHALNNEEPATKGNILRRQLSPEKIDNFDPQQHVFTVQQSLGSDSTDVYSASVTTGNPRPLFTTTHRPRALLASTTVPTLISSTRGPLIRLGPEAQDYAQQESAAVTESTVNDATSTTGPIVQIPANRATPEPLVALRHPAFQQGTILVPLSQIQNYQQNQEPYVRDNTTPRPVEQRPVYVRRLPPPQFRPIPVQVDENGYIRDVASPQENVARPYHLPVPVTPVPKYNVEEPDNDIEHISPPVSTRDFQKLLQQLIIRQTRLERISALTDPRRRPDYYHQQPLFSPRYRQYPQQRPYYRVPEAAQNGPVRFVPEYEAQRQQQRQYVQVAPQAIRQRQEQELYNHNSQSYVPNRRVARLLQPSHIQRQEDEEQAGEAQQYLPPDVREMLLLRMLQLAINPGLPLGDDEVPDSTTAGPIYKRAPVRNVEILGEDDEEDKRSVRSKRYRESDVDYYA